MTTNRNAASRIIVALDVDSRGQASKLMDKLPEAVVFKIGLRLFTGEGPALLQTMAQNNKKIFLDLKLHDIPHTVAGAAVMAARHGVSMMTLHASGGRAMMQKAAEAVEKESQVSGRPRPLLLGVTILTSLKDAELADIGMPADAGGQVMRLAHLAQDGGMDGIVCSPQELSMVRAEFGTDFIVVTPGIRPAWAAANDQKRIMTPAMAVRQGADYLVIGRPIIAADSPGEAFQKIALEIAPNQKNPTARWR